ncbi:MAG TPA: hypothetical protein DEQ20_00310 [Desulfobulbaceae bacterium]|nr:MAG: hypothetical protein A2520_02700 [Deltaproteobacteria bacterium RIFOXYD12_FULL_53_23]HCC53364.1 hypothetical protein [Desulfobulbaceae bacterium]
MPLLLIVRVQIMVAEKVDFPKPGFYAYEDTNPQYKSLLKIGNTTVDAQMREFYRSSFNMITSQQAITLTQTPFCPQLLTEAGGRILRQSPDYLRLLGVLGVRK